MIMVSRIFHIGAARDLSKTRTEFQSSHPWCSGNVVVSEKPSFLGLFTYCFPARVQASQEQYLVSILDNHRSQLLRRIRPRHGSVLMLTDKLCVKYGSRVHLSEASTIQFVSQHTIIPVPKVLCAFEHSGLPYIVMERIKGDIIGNGWVKRSEESNAKLLSQLKHMVAKVRAIRPPEGMGVASVDGGSLYDCRVPGPSLRFGPFSTTQVFHRHLRSGMELDPRLDTEVQDLILQHNRSWPLVFTHGDLSSLDVLVRGDEIVGINDWETPDHIGSTPLPTRSTHKTPFGPTRLISFLNQCQKS